MDLLLNEILKIAKQNSALSFTVIDNPRYPRGDLYSNLLITGPTDRRISQITNISVLNMSNSAKELMDKFHHKTRNMIRKSEKSNFSVYIDNTSDGFEKLYNIHSENMRNIGGKEKELSVFNAIHDVFEPEKDYNIYFAKKDDHIAAGLLVFYFKEYCEYFTPVINQNYRAEQPLSLLIFRAMQDAVIKGARFWNWGGTWLSQDGVYLFKKRWGTDESYYDYYTKIFHEDRIDRDRDGIVAEAPYFYIKNFRVGYES